MLGPLSESEEPGPQEETAACDLLPAPCPFPVAAAQHKGRDATDASGQRIFASHNQRRAPGRGASVAGVRHHLTGGALGVSVWLRAGRALNRRNKCAGGWGGGSALHGRQDEIEIRRAQFARPGDNSRRRRQTFRHPQERDHQHEGKRLPDGANVRPARSSPANPTKNLFVSLNLRTRKGLRRVGGGARRGMIAT